MGTYIERLTSYQLPNRYVKIGFTLTILSFLAIIGIKMAGGADSYRFIAKQLMLVGLLLVSISRDKEEDELIVKLRMQSYSFAFIVAIIYALWLPVLDYLIDAGMVGEQPTYDELGDFMILWLLLSIQVFSFYALKRSHT